MKSAQFLVFAALAVLALGACGESGGILGGSENAQVENTEFPENVYWGDTHLHTSNSVDAFGFGVRLGPEEALRFASGEEVTATKGLKAKLDRPLDFLVIADHSDALGATRQLYEAPRIMIRDETLRRWYDEMHESPEGSLRVTGELIDRAGAGTLPPALTNPEAQKERTRSLWQDTNAIIEKYNKPGKFSAFVGFEYTEMPSGNNLHRVVMFRDGAEKTDQVLPFPALSGENVTQLWDYMEAYEKNTGGSVLAIPHNSNLSNGLMFEMVGPDGGPMTAEYAKRRAQWEPIVEVTQIKGDSETHPFLSPNDEYADFGVAGWDLGNLTMQEKTAQSMLAGSYVREALKRGLAIQAKTGVNPYKLGMIGSTDSHTSLATADQDNFFGKHSMVEPNKNRVADPQNLGTRAGRLGWHYLSSGYAAVWATSNTREAIFDAMRRREVYATTGPRMQIRMFGGYGLDGIELNTDWVKAAYQAGVPMGGEISGEAGKTPSFIVFAQKDPQGANLDRVQIVKGWVDSSGQTQEKVFNVVWSDMQTRIESGGKLPAVGDTVDVDKVTYENSIGTSEMQAVWADPEFDPGQRAFYYMRVIEIPTPRWVLFDRLRYGAKLPADAQLKVQERAYSSPIWYNPAAPKGG